MHAVELLATQRISWRFVVATTDQRISSKSVLCGSSLNRGMVVSWSMQIRQLIILKVIRTIKHYNFSVLGRRATWLNKSSTCQY
jgi:hypothetical protein